LIRFMRMEELKRGRLKMKDNKQIMCDECKRLMPISDIKYSVKGSSTIRMCSDCRERIPKNKRVDAIKNIEEPVKKQKIINNNKARYVCTKCRYYFNHDPSRGNNPRCPYCSSSDYVTSTNNLSSSKILKEVANLG